MTADQLFMDYRTAPRSGAKRDARRGERSASPPAAIPILSAKRFAEMREELVMRGQAAVVTGLFDGQPVAALASLDKTRALIGAAPVLMSRNYADAKLDHIVKFTQGRKPKAAIPREPTSLGAYLDLALREPGTRWIVAEQPVPDAVLAMADLRSLGIGRIAGGYADCSAAHARDQAQALLFVANAGNASDVHCDWDSRDVLLYQGFGRKRVTVFPAAAAPLLYPYNVYGTLKLSAMPEPVRRALLLRAGGVEHILEPGETMFMPAFVWHHIEYLDLALSVSFRFAGIEDEDALFLVHHLHRDHYVQNLLAASRDPQKAAACRTAILDIREAFEEPYASARAKYRVLRARVRARCEALGLIYQRYPRQSWIEFDELIDGMQCSSYHTLPAGSPLKRWFWHSRERVRSLTRRLANRVAYWA